MRPFLKSSKREKREHLDDDLVVVVAHEEKDEKSMAACLSREMQKSASFRISLFVFDSVRSMILIFSP